MWIFIISQICVGYRHHERHCKDSLSGERYKFSSKGKEGSKQGQIYMRENGQGYKLHMFCHKEGTNGEGKDVEAEPPGDDESGFVLIK